MVLEVVTVIWYLWGFIGGATSYMEFMGEKLQMWEGSSMTLTGLEWRSMQELYVGMYKYLLQEWKLIQCITPGVGPESRSVEEDLWEDFILVLLHYPEE